MVDERTTLWQWPREDRYRQGEATGVVCLGTLGALVTLPSAKATQWISNPTGHSLKVHISSIKPLVLTTCSHRSTLQLPWRRQRDSPARFGLHREREVSYLPLVPRFPEACALSTPADYFSGEWTVERIKQQCCKNVIAGSATASPIKGLAASGSSGTTA